MSGITLTTAPWYASRATGVVSLLLFTAVGVLGLLVTRQGRLPGLPRFAVAGLHRNLSLLAVVFVSLHVLTAVADSFVHIPLSAAVIPLASSYEPLSVGLGAVSVDIAIALIATSLLRRHMSRRLWRAVHLLAYASWPVSWLHSVSASPDLQHGVLFLLAIGCGLAVTAAFIWRVYGALRDVPRAQRVGLVMDAVHSRASLRNRFAGRDTRSPRGGTASMETEAVARRERTSRR